MTTQIFKILCLGTGLVQTLLMFVLLQGGYADQAASHTDDLPVFRVGYLPVLSQLPLIISYDRDRYSYENIRIELVEFKSYIALEAAFRVQAIDIAYLPVPTILKMKVDGVAVLIGDSLHRGGFSMVIGAGSAGKINGRAIFGIPGFAGNGQLILGDYLADSGGSYGKNYRTITVQLSDAEAVIERGQVDGIIFPEPYPTKVLVHVPGLERIVRGQHSRLYTLQSALVFNRERLSGNMRGLLEWLESLEKSCIFLAEDIDQYEGAQTVISQQRYFGFDMALVRDALNYPGRSLSFSPERITKVELEKVVEKMISEKLLPNSLNLDNVLLRTYFP